MPGLSPGQNLSINRRLWSVRQITPLAGRLLRLDLIGASEAAQGMTRRLEAIQVGENLFIVRRRGGYWQANLRDDWSDGAGGPVLVCRDAGALDLLDAHTRSPLGGDELKNEFSWSYSRAAKYRLCPRAYYYHYYAAWDGWRSDAPSPVQKAYLLKNLTDIPRWVGTLVHESIKFALARLKTGQPVSEAELIQQMHRRAQADFESSRSGQYQQRPNHLTGFQEHYYREKLAPSVWQEAWRTAEQYLQTFLHSTLYEQLSRWSPNAFLDVETLQSFTLAGTKVWLQMDLAGLAGETIYLYDWKTGAIDEAAIRAQLGIYGLYIRQRKADRDDLLLRGMAYSLSTGQVLEFPLDDAALRSAQSFAEASIDHLQSLLSGPPQANRAAIRRFPMIDDLSVCRRCQFRELCNRA